MNNPKIHMRALRLIRLCAVAMLLGVMFWSVIPSSRIDTKLLELEETSQEDPGSSDLMRAVEESAFDITLWDVPPLPETPRQIEPARVARLSLQLMAITTIRDDMGQPVQYGVLYDPDTDQLHTISQGQEISGYTLSEIKTDSITLQSGSREVRLLLDPDGDV